MSKKIYLGEGYNNLSFSHFTKLKIFNERIEIKIAGQNYTFSPDEVNISKKFTIFHFAGFAIQFNYSKNDMPLYIRFWPFRQYRQSILKQLYLYSFHNIEAFE